MKNHGLNRRRFIRNASAGIIGAGILGAKAPSRFYRKLKRNFPKLLRTQLGRTNFKGFGYRNRISI